MRDRQRRPQPQPQGVATFLSIPSPTNPLPILMCLVRPLTPISSSKNLTIFVSYSPHSGASLPHGAPTFSNVEGDISYIFFPSLCAAKPLLLFTIALSALLPHVNPCSLGNFPPLPCYLPLSLFLYLHVAHPPFSPFHPSHLLLSSSIPLPPNVCPSHHPNSNTMSAHLPQLLTAPDF